MTLLVSHLSLTVTVMESIPWWRDFRISFKKKFKTMETNLGSDFVFGLAEPLPLYRDNHFSWAEVFNDEDLRHEFNDLISQINGNYIVKKMMIKTNDF